MAFDMYERRYIRLSYQFRVAGNQNLNRSEYFEALWNYNQSLIAANKAVKNAESKELMAFAYSNRSVVYLKVKKYEECLENIKLARLNRYPAEKLQHLEAREQKCNEMIEQQQQKKDPDDDPKDFFKLSYEANEKIPFIVDCLEIRRDENRRRGIFTNQDLKAGDIIAIEEPFLKDLFNLNMRCSTCFKQNLMNLIPGNFDRMFCLFTLNKVPRAKHALRLGENKKEEHVKRKQK